MWTGDLGVISERQAPTTGKGPALPVIGGVEWGTMHSLSLRSRGGSAGKA